MLVKLKKLYSSDGHLINMSLSKHHAKLSFAKISVAKQETIRSGEVSRREVGDFWKDVLIGRSYIYYKETRVSIKQNSVQELVGKRIYLSLDPLL
ncbi:hypothetical protein RB195_014256 [Necator americanus]|uniref:Uncharacterized protein n=1 Tax=Necator americanus TaxID=51031 RepID=A0ABR1DZH3_NECAM